MTAAVRITIVAGAALDRQLTDARRVDVRDAVTADFDGWLQDLAIPARSEVELVRGEDLTFLRIQGRPRYPTPMESERLLGHAARPTAALPAFGAIFDSVHAGEDDADGRATLVADHLSTVASHLVRTRPWLVLDESIATAWWTHAQSTDAGSALNDEPRELMHVLGRLLAAGLALDDHAGILRALWQGRTHGRSAEDVSESLIAGRPRRVVVEVAPDYATHLFGDALTSEPLPADDLADERLPSLLRLADRALADELGTEIPRIAFAAGENLDAGTFAVRVNDLRLMPWAGLQRGQRLVEHVTVEDADRRTWLTRNPVTGDPAAVLDGGTSDLPDEPHLGGALEYLLLALMHDLRSAAPMLVDVDLVEHRLVRLGSDWPDVRDDVTSRLTAEQLTRILRRLLRDGVSVHDLKAIVERLLSFDVVVADSLDRVVLDDRLVVDERLGGRRLPDLDDQVAYVRKHARAALTHQQLRGRSLLPVHRLSGSVEKLILEHLAEKRSWAAPQESRREFWDVLLAAIARTSAQQDDRLIILTASQVASFLRNLLADGLPDVTVLAWDELSPDVGLTPLGCIDVDSVHAAGSRSISGSSSLRRRDRSHRSAT